MTVFISPIFTSVLFWAQKSLISGTYPSQFRSTNDTKAWAHAQLGVPCWGCRQSTRGNEPMREQQIWNSNQVAATACNYVAFMSPGKTGKWSMLQELRYGTFKSGYSRQMPPVMYLIIMLKQWQQPNCKHLTLIKQT